MTKKKISKHLSTTIVDLRERKGLSREALAKAAKTTRQNIEYIERDGALPRLDLLLRLGKALGVDPRDLLPNKGRL